MKNKNIPKKDTQTEIISELLYELRYLRNEHGYVFQDTTTMKKASKFLIKKRK